MPGRNCQSQFKVLFPGLADVRGLVVIGASVVSPVVAGVYWLTRLRDLRAALALLVNVGGLGIDALGIMLAAGHAAG